MHKLSSILILSAFFCGIFAEDNIFVNDSYFSPDKIDHFFTVMAITVATSFAADYFIEGEKDKIQLGISVSVPLIFSVVKEVYDGVSGTGEVSYKDLIYDFAGLAAGILITR